MSAQLGKHEIFTLARTYPPMMVSELSAAAPGCNPPEGAIVSARVHSLSSIRNGGEGRGEEGVFA